MTNIVQCVMKKVVMLVVMLLSLTSAYGQTIVKDEGLT